MELLQRHFIQADIEVILQIKLHPRRVDDVLAWAPAMNGLFTVKSAYWLDMDELHRSSQGATTGHRMAGEPFGRLFGGALPLLRYASLPGS
jgi:hypothetical protein